MCRWLALTDKGEESHQTKRRERTERYEELDLLAHSAAKMKITRS